MKKVLIITYYWPPNGGTGVQRWMHFSRYLKELGWDVTVFTPINAESAVIDTELLHLVDGIKVYPSKIWEPFDIYRKITGKKKSQRIQTGFLQENKKLFSLEKFSLWIRANVFIPDAKMLWIRPAIKEIIALQKEEQFTHMISTGPPHSTHLIAAGVKEKIKIKWLADFRDPWTNIDWFPKLPMTKKTIAKHKYLESNVLKNPDAVVAVTFDMAIEFKEIANREIQVVTNGFAFEDFKNFTSKKSNKLLVFHHGSLNADRNPVKFWKFLGEITKTNEDWKNNLEIQLVGAVDISVLQEIEKNGLLKYLQVKSFMPHSEVIEALSYATLCLLPLNNTPNAKGIMPNKLYEYLATGKPIIVIGPKDGDTAGVIMSFENCCVFDFEEDIEYLVLRECLKKGEISHDLSMFNRYNLAVEIDKLLQSL